MDKNKFFRKDAPDYGDAIEHEHNTTLYGEFVFSMHKWLPLDTQKENTKKLENLTDKK